MIQLELEIWIYIWGTCPMLVLFLYHTDYKFWTNFRLSGSYYKHFSECRYIALAQLFTINIACFMKNLTFLYWYNLAKICNKKPNSHKQRWPLEVGDLDLNLCFSLCWEFCSALWMADLIPESLLMCLLGGNLILR